MDGKRVNEDYELMILLAALLMTLHEVVDCVVASAAVQILFSFWIINLNVYIAVDY